MSVDWKSRAGEWSTSMTRIILAAFLLGLLASCSTPPKPEPSVLQTHTNVSETDTPAASCETVPFTLRARNAHKVFRYPLEGNFAEESHQLTEQEVEPNGVDGWPKTRQQGMDRHLALHAPLLARHGLTVDQVFDLSTTKMKEGVLPYRRVWTGANDRGMYAGAWSRKDKPSIEEEQATFNQAWHFDDAPKWFKGRFLLCAVKDPRRCFVAFAGENGPSDPKWMGGVQPFIAHWLRVKNTEKIRVARLADQTTPLGPRECL